MILIIASMNFYFNLSIIIFNIRKHIFKKTFHMHDYNHTYSMLL